MKVSRLRPYSRSFSFSFYSILTACISNAKREQKERLRPKKRELHELCCTVHKNGQILAADITGFVPVTMEAETKNNNTFKKTLIVILNVIFDLQYSMLARSILPIYNQSFKLCKKS